MNIDSIKKDYVLPKDDSVSQPIKEDSARYKAKIARAQITKDQQIIDSALQVIDNQIVQEGLTGQTPDMIRNKFGLQRKTVKKLLENADPTHLSNYKREVGITKLAISQLLDEVIVSRVENRPDDIRFSELAIASGIMSQRSGELLKDSDVGVLPDFSKMDAWDKPKDPPSDGQVMTNVIDV